MFWPLTGCQNWHSRGASAKGAPESAVTQRGAIYTIAPSPLALGRIWVGTETRDYTDKQWGGTPQYEAYFIMRWLGGIGGTKCGGGWYDPYGTTEQTYVEQARQTILGGARESLLFCHPPVAAAAVQPPLRGAQPCGPVCRDRDPPEINPAMPLTVSCTHLRQSMKG